MGRKNPADFNVFRFIVGCEMDVRSHLLMALSFLIFAFFATEGVGATAPLPPYPLSYPSTNSTGSYTVSWPEIASADYYILQEQYNGSSTWTAVGGARIYALSVDFSSKPNGTYAYRAKSCYLEDGVICSNTFSTGHALTVNSAKVATPAIANAGGSCPSLVTINSGTPDSTIYYTVDGSPPASSGTRVQYTAPFSIPQNITLYAIAIKSGMTNSDVAGGPYTCSAGAPGFSPNGGTYEGSVSVTLISTPADATIRYTTNGGDPFTTGIVYSGSFNLTQNATIRAYASRTNMANSVAVSSSPYTVKVAKTIAVPTANVTCPRAISLTTSTADAAIYYTTDGSLPTTSPARLLYSAQFPILKNTTIRSYAIKTGMTDSEVSDEFISCSAAAPSFSPPSGTYTGSVVVLLTSATSDAAIRYTTNGSDPVMYGVPYGDAINLTQNTTLLAFARKTDMADSEVVPNGYTVKVSKPTIIAEGSQCPRSITINTETGGVSVYYTTDGSSPLTSPTREPYLLPFLLPQNATLSAVAVKAGMADSDVVGGPLTCSAVPPSISPNGGVFTQAMTVSLLDMPVGGAIRYTLDDSEPTDSSPAFNLPIELACGVVNKILKAAAFHQHMHTSDTVAATFSVDCSAQVSLSANPQSIEAGTSSMLTWNAINVDSCTLDGSSVGMSGTRSTGPLTETKTYVLTCMRSGVPTNVNASVVVPNNVWRNAGQCDPTTNKQLQICVDGTQCTLNSQRLVISNCQVSADCQQ